MTTSITLTRNPPYEGAYLFYIAGIEVPVMSITVQMGAGGQQPTARVTMVPDPLLERFGAEDRVEVAAFYLDSIYPAAHGTTRTDFRLLFEGEILGWSYTHSTVGRAIALTCGNFLRILEDLQPVFLSGPESIALNVALPSTGESFTTPQDPITFPWNLFFYGISRVETLDNKTYLHTKDQPIRRPYDLFTNILDVCTGQVAQQGLGSAVATNFFARYMRRVRFHDRFVPSPILEIDPLQSSGEDGVFPVLRAVRDTILIQSIAKQAAQMGIEASIWGTLQQMFLTMYYEVLAITTAPIAQIDSVPDSITNGEILGPPKFIIPTPEQEAAAREQEIRDVYAQIDTAAAIAQEANPQTLTPEGVDEAFRQIEEEKAAARTAILARSPQQPEDPLRPNRILNYVTKPQWLFGIAPSCNVVFPSMVTELNFEENYIMQPTRMYINDTAFNDLLQGGSDLILSLAAMRAGYPYQVQRELERRYGGAKETGASFNASVSGRNFLVWPEEFFKGPRTANGQLQSWFTLLAQYINNNESAEVKALRATKDTDATTSHNLKVQQSLQTDMLVSMRNAYAKYEYFRQRAALRQATVVMTFNPYVVPGFPMVVFDSLTDGQHLVGYVASVTHAMDSRSWSTTVNLTYAQSFDEFMNEVFNARVGNTPEGVLTEINAGPPYPIPVVRDVAQYIPKAEEYFTKLFHRNMTYPGVKTAAFDFTRAIRLVLPSGQSYSFDDTLRAQSVMAEVTRRESEIDKVTAQLEEDTAAFQQLLEDTIPQETANRTEQIATETDTYRQNRWAQYQEELFRKRQETGAAELASGILQKYTHIIPSQEFGDMFDTYKDAMRFVARPICTLEEYINFRGAKGARIGRVSPTSPTQAKGGMYYEQILNLRGGTDTAPAPTFDDNNNLVTPPIADLPDMRYDWVPIMKAYRQRVIAKRLGLRADIPERNK